MPIAGADAKYPFLCQLDVVHEAPVFARQAYERWDAMYGGDSEFTTAKMSLLLRMFSLFLTTVALFRVSMSLFTLCTAWKTLIIVSMAWSIAPHGPLPLGHSWERRCGAHQDIAFAHLASVPHHLGKTRSLVNLSLLTRWRGETLGWSSSSASLFEGRGQLCERGSRLLWGALLTGAWLP